MRITDEHVGLILKCRGADDRSAMLKESGKPLKADIRDVDPRRGPDTCVIATIYMSDGSYHLMPYNQNGEPQVHMENSELLRLFDIVEDPDHKPMGYTQDPETGEWYGDYIEGTPITSTLTKVPKQRQKRKDHMEFFMVFNPDYGVTAVERLFPSDTEASAWIAKNQDKIPKGFRLVPAKVSVKLSDRKLLGPSYGKANRHQ